jgi:hypothetical protein
VTGFYIQEKLEELGMTQPDLAGRIGRTKKIVDEILYGQGSHRTRDGSSVGTGARHARPVLEQRRKAASG